MCNVLFPSIHLFGVAAVLVYEQATMLAEEVTYLELRRRILRSDILCLCNILIMAMMTTCFILRLFSSRTILVRHAYNLFLL